MGGNMEFEDRDAVMRFKVANRPVKTLGPLEPIYAPCMDSSNHVFSMLARGILGGGPSYVYNNV